MTAPNDLETAIYNAVELGLVVASKGHDSAGRKNWDVYPVDVQRVVHEVAATVAAHIDREKSKMRKLLEGVVSEKIEQLEAAAKINFVEASTESRDGRGSE